MFCCFFFKQKTAYEMRISDWSSDVCSSDLEAPVHLVDDILRRLLALLPRLQQNGDRAAVEIVAGSVAARRAGDDRANRPFVQERQQLLLRGEHIFVHLLLAGAERRGAVGGEDADVLGRLQLRSQELVRETSRERACRSA